MLAYISGKIVWTKASQIIVDVAGLGYRINVLPGRECQIESQAALFLHHHLRENIEELYGFATDAELAVFEKLLSVSGVGPKAAMAIMAVNEVAEIITAIDNNNAEFFLKVPGVGKKVAAKIILDLKSKLVSFDDKTEKEDSVGSELADTLGSLGYKRAEIISIAEKMPQDLDSIEARIRWCLKALAK